MSAPAAHLSGAATSDVLVLVAQFLWQARLRVGSGRAADGVDDALEPDTVLTETSVKNRLKAAAAQVGVPPDLVGEVFEGPRGQGSWWNLCIDQPDVCVEAVAHVRIDPATGTADPMGLTTRHDARATSTARLRFSLLRPLPLPQVHRHVLVLLTAARACKSIGGSRTRGLGAWDVQLERCSLAQQVSSSHLRVQLAAVGVGLFHDQEAAR